MIGPESIPRRAEACEAAHFGPDFLLLDADGKILRGLNPSGARIWELLDGTRTVRAIAAELAPEFGLDHARALDGVLAFLQTLAVKRLLAGGEVNSQTGATR